MLRYTYEVHCVSYILMLVSDDGLLKKTKPISRFGQLTVLSENGEYLSLTVYLCIYQMYVIWEVFRLLIGKRIFSPSLE